jgi:dihydrofolate reductase
MCSATGHVRFTPNSDRELPQTVTSDLPPTADMCGALPLVCFGPIADLWLFVTPTKRHIVVPNLTSAVTAAQAILKNLGWGFYNMAKLIFGLNQSLDGYVDHDHQAFAPGPALFRHFIEQVRGLSGSVYGRRMYEVMRYWDEDRPEWDAEERDFAAAWRSQPKWVVSRSLKSVGPNATLVEDDIEAVIRGLKARPVGEIQVGGPDLARSLTDLGLIDEYRLYFRPVVLRWPPAATPPCGQRFNRRGRH